MAELVGPGSPVGRVREDGRLGGRDPAEHRRGNPAVDRHLVGGEVTGEDLAVGGQPGQPQSTHFQTSQTQALPIESAPPVVPGLQPMPASEPPPTTIRRGNETIELRRLTPEEKAVRRIRRTIITIGAGTAVLFAIVVAVKQIEQMKKSGKQRR